MPPSYFAKPEAALKRAHELIHVGKEQDALDCLHETIKARRNKQWSTTHEHIMHKHLELCVTLRKPHVAKDALFQYKGLTQQVAVESLEKVIVHLLALAENKTEEAQKSSIEKVELIDDLDDADAPEHLLLSVVSGAAAQDRMDRTVLSPWLRFLWDSYRNCLELLRNNAQLEGLYHRITRKSFAFCARYQRRAEFRKLCELLRLHLIQIQKHQHLAHVVKLTSAESLALMQETRLVQLDTAIQMELWQEAYRSSEDVHGMMQLSKDRDRRTVKPASYVNYYDKLALVFWKAGNRLFHAAALLQKFIIFKDMKKTFSAEEAAEQATRVLLASLAIPDGADAPSDLTRHLDIEDQHSSNMRLLSNLLRLPIAPTRAGILRECARFGVPENASENARGLFRLLETTFSPLGLTKQAAGILDNIDKPEYAQYVEAIRAVLASKTLKQISVVYDTISWERLQKIIPFYEEMELERFIVDVSKHRFVKAQIDHRAGCVRFGGASEATLASGIDLEEETGFTGDGAQLGVEGIRSHLEIMYSKLRATVEQLDGESIKEAALENVKKHTSVYAHHKMTDHDRILMRRRKIETYKETSERVKMEKASRMAEETARKEEAKRVEEKKRLEQENASIEKRRREADKREVEEKIKADQMRKLLATSFGMNILREYGETAIADMDIDQVLKEQRERLDKERLQTQQRLQQQERKFDHWVRAMHLEEMQERRLRQDRYRKDAPKLWAEYQDKDVAKKVAEHDRQVTVYAQLEGVRGETGDWMEKTKTGHTDDFAEKIREWERKLEAVRVSRLAERAEERKKERKREWERQQAENERRAKEEEEKARLAVLDEQRRLRREAEGGPGGRRGGRDQFDADSKAMADNDWRRGGGESRQPPPPDRAPMRMSIRPIGDDGGRGPERQRGGFPEERQRGAPLSGPPSRFEESETVDNWRSAPRPQQPPSRIHMPQDPRLAHAGRDENDGGSRGPPRDADGRPRLQIARRNDDVETISRADFGTKKIEAAQPPPKRDQGLPRDPREQARDGPRESAAPSEDNWARGQGRAPPPQPPVPSPAQHPTVSKPAPTPEPEHQEEDGWTKAPPKGGRQERREEKPAPPAGGGGVWKPSHMRGEGGPAGSPGGQGPPRKDFGPRGGEQRDGPRDFGRGGEQRDFGPRGVDSRDGQRNFGSRDGDSRDGQRNFGPRGGEQRDGPFRGDRDADRRPPPRTQGGGRGAPESGNWR